MSNGLAMSILSNRETDTLQNLATDSIVSTVDARVNENATYGPFKTLDD